MAERRMFAKSVVRSDNFLDLPQTSQNLYFHLNIEADDDGFVSNPRRLMRMLGNGDDDLRVLIAKGFVISFDSGVVVVRHWKVNNYIQKDRYKPSQNLDEMAVLRTDRNNVYKLDTECIQDGYTLDTQVSVVKASLVKESLGKTLPKIEAKRGFNNIHSFKKWVVKNLEGYKFTTQKTKFFEDTEFEIRGEYIYSHFSKSFLDSKDAIEIWQYLYLHQMQLLELVQNAS